MIWIAVAVAIITFGLILAYALCAAAARADLRALHSSVTWTHPPDPRVTIYGGPYDAIQRGDFD